MGPVTPAQKAYNVIHALDERLEAVVNSEAYTEFLLPDVEQALDDLHEAEKILEDADLAAHEKSEWKRVVLP